MKPNVIFTAPEQTSYHDNTTWLKTCVTDLGYWLKPGERLAILPPEVKDIALKYGVEVQPNGETYFFTKDQVFVLRVSDASGRPVPVWCPLCMKADFEQHR